MIDFSKYPWVLPPIAPPEGAKPITLNTPTGPRTFISGGHASRELGISQEAVRRCRRRQERKKEIVTAPTGRKGKTITICGFTFTKQKDAAAFFDVSEQRISQIKNQTQWRFMEISNDQ